MTTEPQRPETWVVEVSDECVSSRQCIVTAADLFVLGEDGFSSPVHHRVGLDRTDDLRQAVDGCPVGAISTARG